jgi:hypothetical protein
MRTNRNGGLRLADIIRCGQPIVDQKIKLNLILILTKSSDPTPKVPL